MPAGRSSLRPCRAGSLWHSLKNTLLNATWLAYYDYNTTTGAYLISLLETWNGEREHHGGANFNPYKHTVQLTLMLLINSQMILII